MNTKPKPIRWLEEHTGQSIAYPEADAASTAPHGRGELEATTVRP